MFNLRVRMLSMPVKEIKLTPRESIKVLNAHGGEKTDFKVIDGSSRCPWSRKNGPQGN
jgi:hypothetical protein